MNKQKTLLSLLLGLLPFLLLAQKKNEDFVYHLHRATGPIRIDGIADDPAWENGELATDFYMVLPMDTSRARVRTEVRMLYDEENLYLLAINYEKVPGPYYVESLRRDFNFGKNDNFLLAFDTFDDQTNGFTFGANAMGAQWDGLLYNGGAADLSWDNKWVSAVQSDDDKWVFEMAVPFKSIRYKQGVTRWGVNFSRLDLKTTEKSAWAPVPRQFPTVSLAYTGVLLWDEPPPAVGANVSVIPYMLSGISKNYETKAPSDYRFDIGGDAKIGVTSSLNLDLTVNPDFSQVEVDVQQTNLDRFELFFPERRQFFIENADLFANFGYDRIRPFFSRRIGLDQHILFGARLSGKIDKNWRIGAMNMQTKKEGSLPAQNFSVLGLQRRIFSRSNLGLLFVNQETFDYESVDNKDKFSRYNRNLGFEYNLASSNNIWTGKLLFLQSFSPGDRGADHVLAGNILHNSRHWNYGMQYDYVGQNFRSDVGFVPRTGYHRVNPKATYLFFPRSRTILSHGPSLDLIWFLDDDYRHTDEELTFTYKVSFQNRAEFSAWAAKLYIRLLKPFDPTNTGVDQLAAGTEHRGSAVGFNFTSKPQSLFTWALSSRYGAYYADGKLWLLNGEAGFRFQPFVAVALRANYSNIRFFEDDRLPASLVNTTYRFWLVGPRIDVTMTNKLFLTAFLQYNTQTNNINLNTRLQWRYSPASDLFLVYTDNYYADVLQVRNRALVLKFTYWWNL